LKDDAMRASDPRGRFQLVQGGGPGQARELEQLDRFLVDVDPLQIPALQGEERSVRGGRQRRLAQALGVAVVGLAVVVWAGRAASDEEQGRLKLEQGRELVTLGKFDEALASFSGAVRLAPDLADAWAELGVSQLRHEESKPAEESFHKALALEPGNPRALHGLGTLHLRRGDGSQAEESYLRGGLNKQLAGLYLLQGRFHEAQVRLAPLLHDFPEDEEIYRMAEAARSHHVDSRLQSLLDPEPTGLSRLTDKGWHLAYGKSYSGAIRAFNQALRLHPKDVSALSGLGTSLLALNRTAEAQTYFERALVLDSDNLHSLDGLARCLRKQGHTDAAILVWKRMADLFPTAAESTPGLAWAYFEKGNYRQAAVYFARLVRTNPNDPRVVDALNVAVQNIGLTAAE
jgi:Flp pilus assembly protein TadD